MNRDISSQLLILLSTLLCHLCLTDLVFSTELGDVELSGYALGSWPRDQETFNHGTIVPASVQQGFGAGVKVGFFPSRLHGVLGLALDSNIHSGALSFPNVAKGQAHDTGHSDLLVTIRRSPSFCGIRVSEFVRTPVSVWAGPPASSPTLTLQDKTIRISTQHTPLSINFLVERRFSSAPRCLCSASIAMLRAPITGMD